MTGAFNELSCKLAVVYGDARWSTTVTLIRVGWQAAPQKKARVAFSIVEYGIIMRLQVSADNQASWGRRVIARQSTFAQALFVQPTELSK